MPSVVVPANPELSVALSRMSNTRVAGLNEDHQIVVADIQHPPATARRLAGLVMPSLSNVHSDCFHRAWPGRTNGGGGTFWTWREQIAARLNPGTYNELARATFAEIRVTEIAPGLTATAFYEARFGEDHERARKVFDGVQRLTSEAVAECIRWDVSRSPHVNIDELVVRPLAQATAMVMHRSPESEGGAS
jgi:hypothetical protein